MIERPRVVDTFSYCARRKVKTAIDGCARGEETFFGMSKSGEKDLQRSSPLVDYSDEAVY